MEFFRSISIYSRGILKRIYWLLLFFLFSDPFNVAERWFGVTYEAPSYLVWVLLFIGFCFASFFTFHSLRKSIVKKEKKRQLRLMLADFIPDGENLKLKCLKEHEQAPRKETLDWAQQAKDYLAKSFGDDYANIFLNSDGLGAIASTIRSIEHRRLYVFITHRLSRIQQILTELRTN